MIKTNPIPPTLLEDWHPILNEGVDPHFLTAYSGKKVWWLGKCGHEWQTSITNRVRRNSPCPVCIGKKILVGFNDLATTHPELIQEWHPTKNDNLVPYMFSRGMNIKIWWICSLGHEWQSSINDRANRKTGCHICVGREVLPGFNDLATKAPDIASQWHPVKNGKLTPEHVTKSANKKAWWLCEQGHDWEAMIKNRTSLGRGCPVCVGQLIIKGINDLASLRPELSSEWHPVLNGKLRPSQVSLNSNKKVWWLGKCSHEWMTAVANRSHESNLTNCPVCSGNVVMPGFNDLVTTHPDLAADWHPRNNATLSSTQVSAGSNKKAWWLGETCQHEWQQVINDRVQGAGCLVCSGKIILPGFNDLATTHSKIAAEWHPVKNKSLTPQMVSKGYEKRVWWKCIKGHEWDGPVYDRVRSDSICRNCSPSVSKSEQELAGLLVANGFAVKQSDRKTIKKMEIDIHVKANKFAIEYNGLYWHTESKGKHSKYHFNKWKKCRDKGIELCQIWEDQFRANPDLVKRLVLDKLGVYTNGIIDGAVTTCTPVQESEAKVFMALHNLDGSQEASSYFGLQDTNGELVFLAGVNLKDDSRVEIISICSSKEIKGGFIKMVDYLISLLSPTSIEYTVDNCFYAENLLIDAGFVHTVSLTPGFTYHVNAKRVSLEEYPVSRFKSDPALAWKEGLSAWEIADLNGLERIWDAGKTLWVKSCR